MNPTFFTFYHLPLTLLSPLAIHLEAQGKRINNKLLKKVKGELVNEATGRSAL